MILTLLRREFISFSIKMFGDRQADCVDEIMNALIYLRDKAQSHKWYEFVTYHTKAIQCDSKDNDVASYAAYTHPTNVEYNMLMKNKARPEAMIGTNSYDQENQDWNYWWMTGLLAHESCHVKQIHEFRMSFMSSIADVEKECHIAARDALIDMDGPQDMIDWNRGIIDRYNGIIGTQEAQQAEGGGAQVQGDLQKLQEDMKEAHENLPPFPSSPPPEANATAAAGNATIPEGPGEFGSMVPPPPFVPDDNQTQPGEEGSSRAEEE
jgi:hypothetical protein